MRARTHTKIKLQGCKCTPVELGTCQGMYTHEHRDAHTASDVCTQKLTDTHSPRYMNMQLCTHKYVCRKTSVRRQACTDRDAHRQANTLTSAPLLKCYEPQNMEEMEITVVCSKSKGEKPMKQREKQLPILCPQVFTVIWNSQPFPSLDVPTKRIEGFDTISHLSYERIPEPYGLHQHRGHSESPEMQPPCSRGHQPFQQCSATQRLEMQNTISN